MSKPLKITFGFILGIVLASCNWFGGDDTEHDKSDALAADFGCQVEQVAEDQTEIARRYTLFESGQVRPLALSPDGQRLFVVNTPNNCLEVYAADSSLKPLAAIPVGLEPVAVAAPTNDEVWVVNHLSDSVSVIDLQGVPHVKHTLWVGDEPSDIVFAGTNQQRAFITAAYRGQNHPHFKPAHLRENGHGRADVWVFDRLDLGKEAGGSPVTVINLFSDVPRALAVSADGATVYAAAFSSGNGTMVLEADALNRVGTLQLGYYRNAAGGDLSQNQMEDITGIRLDSLGLDLNSAIALGINTGFLQRVDGRLVAPYQASAYYRINTSGQVIDQRDGSIVTVEKPAGVELAAAPNVPPYQPQSSKPAPSMSEEGIPAPETGLIVKKEGDAWRDEAGTDWRDKVEFSLPDYDVFEIDALADIPAETFRISGVGTTLFSMSVNPVSGKIYVSNLEANNHIRFEGPGGNNSTVRGNISQSRISVLEKGMVQARNLNKHLTHEEAQGQAVDAGEKAKTLSQPQQMAISADGSTMYVAALGSNKIGIFSTQALEQDSFVPDAAQHISLPGSGPMGVLIDATGTRLFVSSRFDNGLHVIDLASKQLVTSRTLFSPEPQSIITGRRFLYDANLTSANGENACSSCHIFADLDALSWDLGDPSGTASAKPINLETPLLAPSNDAFHPMKGPMSTQTLRGMANHGPMHWRGDRTGDNPAVVNGQTESREAAAFKQFNGAFVSLLGRSSELSDSDMQAFADFALQLMPPPNPVRALDNSLSASQQRGFDIYMSSATTAVGTCNQCHEVDKSKRRFGTDTTVTNEGGRVSQDFKVAQLRNAYTKVGRFDDGQEQVRGFGFLHDGSEPTLLRFFNSSVFTFSLDSDRNDVTDFVFAMESNLAPVVGQQVTVTKKNRAAASARLELLVAQAQAQACDLVATAVVGHTQQRLLFDDQAQFSGSQVDGISQQRLLEDHLPVTFTCYPPGNGLRAEY